MNRAHPTLSISHAWDRILANGRIVVPSPVYSNALHTTRAKQKVSRRHFSSSALVFESFYPLPDEPATKRNLKPPRCASSVLWQSKKVAVAGGDASIRIIDIVEEKTVDVY